MFSKWSIFVYIGFALVAVINADDANVADNSDDSDDPDVAKEPVEPKKACLLDIFNFAACFLDKIRQKFLSKFGIGMQCNGSPNIFNNGGCSPNIPNNGDCSPNIPNNGDCSPNIPNNGNCSPNKGGSFSAQLESWAYQVKMQIQLVHQTNVVQMLTRCVDDLIDSLKVTNLKYGYAVKVFESKLYEFTEYVTSTLNGCREYEVANKINYLCKDLMSTVGETFNIFFRNA